MIFPSKRAQAALEYLSTYGWSFLVLGVALSTLFYFGLFDTSRYQGDDCIAPPGFVCLEYAAEDTISPQLQMIVVNDFPADLDLLSTEIELNSGTAACTEAPNSVTSGETFTITCPLNQYIARQRTEAKVDLTFKQSASNPGPNDHTVTFIVNVRNQ